MANYTTNLSLKEPVDSEGFDIADFNGNADKIDAAFGAGFGRNGAESVSQAISTYDMGNMASLSALETALVTLAGTMSDNQIKRITILVTSAFGSFSETRYIGEVIRYNSTRIRASFLKGQTGQAIVGNYNNSIWSWDSYALKNEIAPYNLGSLTSLSAIESALLTFSNSLSTQEVRVAYGQVGGSYGLFAQTGYNFTVRKLDVNRCDVMAYRGNSIDVIVGNCLNGTWTWDMLALNSNLENKLNYTQVGEITSGSPLSLTFKVGSRCILHFFNYSNTDGFEEILLNVNTANTLTAVGLRTSSGVSFTTSGRTITLSSSLNTYTYIYASIFSGGLDN